MKHITNLLAIAILSLALSSCGALKRTTKIDTSVKVKTSDSTHIAIRKTDSSATSKTITREKVDTTVNIPGSTNEGTKELEELLNGDSLVIDDKDQRVVVEFDSETQRLKARAKVKDREQRVLVDKETIQENAVDVKREDTDATKVVKSDTDAEQHKDVKSTTRIGPSWGTWVVLYLMIGFATLLAVVFYRIKAK